MRLGGRMSLLAAAVLGAAGALAAADAPKPVPLFNGKDLAGWGFHLVDPNAKMGDVWSVRDGILVCKGEPIGYLHTLKTFTSYRLVVEWRWAPGTVVDKDRVPNSGVLLRVNGEPRGIPRAIEAQLRSGNAGDLYGFWGMKIAGDPARLRSRAGDKNLGDMVGVSRTEGAELPVGEWNRYEIVADGPRLTVHVNGKKVNEAWDCDVTPGAVALQSEGGEIHFRKVELTPIE
jgi:hypothetical protein